MLQNRLIWAALTAIVAWTLVQRHGEPARAAAA